MNNDNNISLGSLFATASTKMLDADPVYWSQNNIVLEGRQFNISKGTGWEFLHEPYRYIGIEATSEWGRPVVLLKGRQVGATLMAEILSLFFIASGNFKNLHGLHGFPIVTQANRFSSSKFDPLVNDSQTIYDKRFTSESVGTGSLKPIGGWNASTKQFRDNCSLLIEGISVDGGRIRGASVNFAFFDEVQDMLAVARQNVRQSLKMASSPHRIFGPIGRGVEVNFGTPHEQDSNFDRALWQNSDQRFYNLKCRNKSCGKTFPLYVYGSDSWKTVWVKKFTVQCIHCGLLQDKRKCVDGGEWIPTNINTDCSCGGHLQDIKGMYTCTTCGATDDSTIYRGYHWNQLFIPMFTKEFILAQERELDPLVFKTEVLGEFYSGSALPISYEEIYNRCAKDHSNICLPTFLLPTPAVREIALGIDWGGKVSEAAPGGSWTVATVMSKDLTGTDPIPYKIEYCQKIPSQRMSEQIEIISEIIKGYGVNGTVVDIGFGHQQALELQLMYGDRVKSCYSSGNIKKPYDYNKKNQLITINKDVVIDEIHSLLRKGLIIFPYQNPEETDWLMRHCASMRMKHVELHGVTRKRFVKGTKPNDGLMAMMYAYISIKYRITSAFANLNPATYGNNSTMPSPATAYLPTSMGGRGKMFYGPRAIRGSGRVGF